MEQLLSPLVFNGSIVEAITEAKQQKKLFVVFVSGNWFLILFNVIMLQIPLVCPKKNFKIDLGDVAPKFIT